MSSGPTGFTQKELIDMMSDPKTANYKKYFTYDGSGNVTYIYIAQANATTGDACLRCRIAYVVVGSSTLVRKMDYDTSTWDSSYDI